MRALSREAGNCSTLRGMTRVINFNAGPAALPLDALELAQQELLDYAGTGMSIMEQSHRDKPYEAVHDEVLSLLRELLAVPANYEILLMQGGARQQFAQVPMNLLHAGKSADYIVTGVWAEKAWQEAQYLGTARVAASTKQGEAFTRIPKPSELQLDAQAAYVHITSNNTLVGTQWANYPPTGNVPLIADMTSDLLCRPIDVAKFGLIYAAAQKNVGPAGVTVVIVRKDLVDAGRNDIPEFFRYSTHAKERSLYNTPATFSIYMARNVLRSYKASGGLHAIEQTNREKARLLYEFIDAHPNFYRSPVEKESRSIMNVVWRLPSEDLEKKFLEESKRAGMAGLKGHRIVGGLRASIYNAVSVNDVKALVAFMEKFAASARVG